MHSSNTFGKSFDMREVFTEKELLLQLFLKEFSGEGCCWYKSHFYLIRPFLARCWVSI